jgi:hypothetical protein
VVIVPLLPQYLYHFCDTRTLGSQVRTRVHSKFQPKLPVPHMAHVLRGFATAHCALPTA